MGSVGVERRWVAQYLCKILLEDKRQSLILIAEKIHAWQIVPGFICRRLQKGLFCLRLQLGDPLLLLGGREVAVEDDFFLGGVAVSVVVL
jgi:hypothetical protein